MIEVAIMIEGQNGLNWTRWKNVAKAVEGLGFAGLYRSDHYTNANPPDKDSLELWVSLTWLADNTDRIDFGPLVTPFSFREPTMTARIAAAVDDLSAGRLTLGLGAGWQEREHEKFGHDLLEISPRFDRFEEGLAVISQLLQSEEPVTFSGDYYQLNEAVMYPRPERKGGPPILIGGNGPTRTPRAVARYATEWNALFLPPSEFAKRNAKLDQFLAEEGREATEVKRSMMTGFYFGMDSAEITNKLGDRDPDALRKRGLVIGTPSEVVDQLGAMAEAGVQRVMLQWLDLDDLDGLENVASTILPQVSG